MELDSMTALKCLDDIAHGRKMEHDPHELKKIVARDLDVLELIRDKKVDVGILYRSCFPKQYNLCRSCDTCLTEDEFNKIKEWLDDR